MAGQATAGARRTLASIVALVTLALVMLVMACGTQVHTNAGTGAVAPRWCPGAPPCPYSQVATIGRRAEGVLRVPEAIALGPHGSVYVADQFSHVVQRFSNTGRFEGEWGSYGEGPGQFGAIGALAVTGQGEVYAVDSSHDRIEELDARGDFIRAWGRRGSRLGEFDFGGGGGPDKPPGGGIAVAGSWVYVADTNNDRIERFSLTGTGAVAFTRAGGNHAGGNHARFAGPRGVVVSDNTLYVADLGHGRVVALSLHGRFIGQSRRRGPRAQRLNDPYGLAAHAGNVYVADDNNGRVVELNRQLQYIRAYTGRGVSRVSKWLRDVAVDTDGRVYIADSAHGRVVVLARDGSPLRTWGVIGTRRGEMTLPLAVAADRHGNVLVVATYGIDSPIYRYGPAFGYRGSWMDGGGTVVGHHWFAPTAADIGPDGSLWVTDRDNGVIRHLSPSGTFLGTLGSAGPDPLAYPEGVAVSPTGEVYVADTQHNRIVRLAPDGRLLGSIGQRGPRAQRLRLPTALAVAPDGEVYVADSAHNRIAVFDTDGRFVTSWGGPGSAAGHFEDPAGIAVGAHGHVFVSDRGNDRVQELSAHGHFLTQLGAPGVGAGDLSQPGGLAIDCHGDLLVADTQNNRVEVFRGAAAATGCGR